MSDDLRAEVLRDGVAATVWREVAVRDEVSSTNDELLADPRPWRVLTADHQTSGRGRLDRSWKAPKGAGIALSATLPLPQDPMRWGWVPLLAGLAVRRAVCSLTDLRTGLKWPNDLLVRSDDEWRKVAGLLCAVSTGEAPVVVVGIGLNVHQSAAELPTESATSLALCGAPTPRESLILAILRELVVVQRQWSTDRADEDYRAACVSIGARVRLQTGPEEFIEGDAETVDGSGRLVIQTASGRAAYAAGDVVHVRTADDGHPAPESLPSGSETAPGGGRELTAQDSAAFVDGLEARLMGHPRTMRRQDISDAAGIPVEVTASTWRSLGFASARDDEVIFGEADLEALRHFDALIGDSLLDATTALGLARAVGRSTDRMAMWSLQLIADMVSDDRGGVDSDIAQRTALLTVELADRMGPLVDYVWRRNLSVAISRMVADSEPESHVGIVRTVGFADLVNFTQLVRQLTERELAQLVLRFESLASDIVGAHGGAVIKTVGDEVLFTHTGVGAGVDIAFELLAAAEADELVPKMRVGMARGRVLARLGDIYGNTVNRSSRLTGAAKPGTLLVDADVVNGLPADTLVRVKRRKRLNLTGIGSVEGFVLERPIT